MKSNYATVLIALALVIGFVCGHSTKKQPPKPAVGPHSEVHSIEVVGPDVAETLWPFEGEPPHPDRPVWTIRFGAHDRAPMIYRCQPGAR